MNSVDSSFSKSDGSKDEADAENAVFVGELYDDNDDDDTGGRDDDTAERKKPGRNKVPMSSASISHALDRLDENLEKEEEDYQQSEENSNGESIVFESALSGVSIAPSSEELWRKRKLNDGSIRSHRLDFTSQYPHMAIITTAALPWLTGTAVNPALRAVHLWKRGHDVTLLVPWVEASVQPRIFPDGITFDSPHDQAVSFAKEISKRISFEFSQMVVIDATSLKIAPLLTSSSGTKQPAIQVSSIRKDGIGVDFGINSAEENINDYLSATEIGVTRYLSNFENQQQNGVQEDDNLQSLEDAPLTVVTAQGKVNCDRQEVSSINFRLIFYAGRYDAALGSIMPKGDLQQLIPTPVDCIVLEEPEHLTWYHTGKRWTRAFHKSVPVVGIMHTNYVDYARRMAGDTAAGTLKRLNKFLCRQHTHKCIKLSDAVQKLPRQETCFVHGVSEGFLRIGAQKAREALEMKEEESNYSSREDDSVSGFIKPSTTDKEKRVFSKGIYFLGKALWAKGFAELLDRFSEYKDYAMQKNKDSTLPQIDVYGKGDELEDIKRDAAKRGLPLIFLGAKDHMSPDMAEYKCFVNPSTSDVVATTSAEALAMGKWLIVPEHPCNEWLSTFSNCIVYNSPSEFCKAIDRVLLEDPQPLTDEERSRLSWDTATERLMYCCASVDVNKGPALARMAAKTGWVGYNVGYSVYIVISRAIESVRSDLKDRKGRRENRIIVNG